MLILAFAMLLAMIALVHSVLREVEHEAEEVLDAWQFIVASDLLRDVLVMLRKERLNDAWLALETTRGLENSWLSRFSNSPALLFLGEKQGKELVQDQDEIKAYIWLTDREGKVLLGKPMPGHGGGWHDRRRHIRTVQQKDHAWRVASVADETGEHRIFVAQRDDLRTYLARETGNHLFRVQLVVIPLVMMALGIGIWHALRPLSRLREQITSRQPGNLEPVPLDDVPTEVLPVVEATNELLARLRDTLESERAFTANAAHELRNPLAVVRNLSRVVSEARDPDEVRRCGELLEQSMERMSNLISQLLYLARLDVEAVESPSTPCDLREVLNEVVAVLLPRAVQRRIEIDYQPQVEAQLYIACPLLSVLLTNLLSNAIKYGAEGGTVQIRVQVEGEDLLIKVLDDGPGVKPSELPRLFDRFYRSATARGQCEGTGLGLAITHRIVELHHGKIWANNRPTGRGLVVTIKLPASRWRTA